MNELALQSSNLKMHQALPATLRSDLRQCKCIGFAIDILEAPYLQECLCLVAESISPTQIEWPKVSCERLIYLQRILL